MGPIKRKKEKEMMISLSRRRDVTSAVAECVNPAAEAAAAIDRHLSLVYRHWNLMNRHSIVVPFPTLKIPRPSYVKFHPLHSLFQWLPPILSSASEMRKLIFVASHFRFQIA